MDRLPEDQRWVFDAGSWILPPGSWEFQGRPCYLYESRGRIRIPTLAWEDCGPGCERAKLWTGIGRDEVTHAEIIVLPDGRAFLAKRLRLERYYQRQAAMLVVVGLSDGEGYALLADMDPDDSSGSCSFPTKLRRRGGKIKMKKAEDVLSFAFSWSENGLRWFKPVLRDPYASCTAHWLADGHMFHDCSSFIKKVVEPGSDEYEIVGTIRSNLPASAADEGLLVWLERRERYGEPGRRSRVRGWAPDGRWARVIFDEFEGESTELAMGGGSIAGFQAGGPEGPSRFWIGPRTLVDQGHVPLFSPNVNVGRLLDRNLATWGDWIAASVRIRVGAEYRNRVVLTRPRKWKRRWIGEAEKFEAIYSLALGPSHLYVAPTEGSETTQYLYRYDLARFEERAQRLPEGSIAPPGALFAS